MSLKPSNAPPGVGLLNAQQIARAKQITEADSNAKANAASVDANAVGGKAREAYMLQQEANRYTPAMVQQMNRSTAIKFLTKYGPYLDPNGDVARAARIAQ